MSFSASLMILSIILIRKILVYRIPSLALAFMWSLVCIRLFVPYSVVTKYNFYSGFYYLLDYLFSSKIKLSQIHLYIGTISQLIQNNLSTILLIWGAGAIGFSIKYLLRFIKTIKLRMMAMPLVKEREYKNFLESYGLSTKYTLLELDGLKSPISCGVIKPTIIFPVNFEKKKPEIFEQAFLHECMHLKYHHQLIQYVLVLILILNWFNPIIWLFYEFVHRDMEIACDKGAIRYMGMDYSPIYAYQLIKFADQEFNRDRNKVVFYNGFTKYILKERIVSIMKFKKLSIASVVVSMLIPTSIACALGPADNYLIASGSNSSSYTVALEEEQKTFSTSNKTIELFVPWEELEPYTEAGSRAVSSYNVIAFRKEYPTFSQVAEKITVTTVQQGHTYKGTLTLQEVQKEGSVYAGYYNGTVYLQK